MKTKLLPILILVACTTSLSAQITQEQADAIVLQYIQNEVTPPYLLYANVNSPNMDGKTLSTYNEENMKVKYACWAYYLNENPGIYGPTQHRYLFVKVDDGNLFEVITSHDFGPDDLTQWMLVPLGVAEIEKGDILIFPNPTTGKFCVSNSEFRIEGVEIFDVFGRKVFEQKETLTVLRSYDLTVFPAGVYFIKITTEKGTITKKIIKY